MFNAYQQYPYTRTGNVFDRNVPDNQRLLTNVFLNTEFGAARNSTRRAAERLQDQANARSFRVLNRGITRLMRDREPLVLRRNEFAPSETGNAPSLVRTTDMVLQRFLEQRQENEGLLLRFDFALDSGLPEFEPGEERQTNPNRQYNSRWRTITPENAGTLMSYISGRYRQNEWQSDDEANFGRILRDDNDNLEQIAFEIINYDERNRNNAHWPWTSEILFDMSRYQFFPEVEAKNYRECCFLHSLRLQFENTIPDFWMSILDKATYFVSDRNVPQSKMEEMAQTIGHRLCFQKPSKQETYKVYYGKDLDEDSTLYFGQIANHAFINEKTGFSMFALRYYPYLMEKYDANIEKFRFVIDKAGHKDTSKSCTSFRAMEYMWLFEVLHGTLCDGMSECLLQNRTKTFMQKYCIQAAKELLQTKFNDYHISNTWLRSMFETVVRYPDFHYMKRIVQSTEM